MSVKLELNRVHVLEKIPGSMQFKLVRTQPAMRLFRDGQVVYIQRGMTFDDGGNPMSKENVPGWFADELKRVNPVVLREVGLTPKGA